ncbi:MAG: hypothetical protein LH610_08100 [Sphingomonas bacterium]|nr:hypothetical protein [Sphingomonas bacterium]
MRAPPSPTGDVKSARPSYDGPVEYYAQEEGLTIDEARKRLSEQWAFQPIFERLEGRLRKAEPDNYVSARINHKPDWHYTLSFKRDPEATLRKYQVNPRFKAAKAAYTEAELKALVAPWLQRFAEERIGTGYAIDPTKGSVSISIPITAAEFRAIAVRKGWGDVPAAIHLSFAAEHHVPWFDPRVAALLRGFASENQATTLQMQRGESGRVVLDDGCLRLAGKGKQKGALVVFHRETGIGLDAQGYLAAVDRRSGKATGRIGEDMSWAAPNPGTEFDGLEHLKAACGDGPVINVGNPESTARFEARYRRAN